MTSKSLFSCTLVASVVVLGLAVSPAAAGSIKNACMSSKRSAASKQLCSCIQTVANKKLTWSDRKLAASFFKDPERAQEIRRSNRAKDEAFWDRYRAFGRQAVKTCG